MSLVIPICFAVFLIAHGRPPLPNSVLAKATPFDDLDRYISQSELKAVSDNYKRIAGFDRQDVM